MAKIDPPLKTTQFGDWFMLSQSTEYRYGDVPVRQVRIMLATKSLDEINDLRAAIEENEGVDV